MSFFDQIGAKVNALLNPEERNKSIIAEVIVRSTDPLLLGPDWAANLEVADLINTYESEGAKEAIKVLKRRLMMETRVQVLSLTLIESLMKNCSTSFHVEVASRDFMTELAKVATNRKTGADVAHQIVGLCGAWSEDDEYRTNPMLSLFGTTHAQLVAHGAGQEVVFSPLVAQEGIGLGPMGGGGGGASRPLVATSTTSTRGAAHHVAEPEPPGQVRLVSAPPAVPPGQVGMMAVEDDALPGVAPPPGAQVEAEAEEGEGDRLAMEEEERLAMQEEEEALQYALAASLEAEHSSQAQQQPQQQQRQPDAPPVQAAQQFAAPGEVERLRGDIATLQGNVTLFGECLGASESAADAAQNELLSELAPALREAAPRVVRLLEGGEVADETLLMALLTVHEQLSTGLAKYDEQLSAAREGLPVAAPATALGAATAASPSPAAPADNTGLLVGDLSLSDEGDLLLSQPPAAPPPAAPAPAPAPAPADDLMMMPPEPSPAEELMQLMQPPPQAPPVPPPGAPAGAGMGHLDLADLAPPLAAPMPPTQPMVALAGGPMPPPSTPPNASMPPPSMPPPSMPPPSMPPPSTPPPSTPPAGPAGAPVVQIIDI